MEIAEFRNKVLEATNLNWFKATSFHFSNPKVGLDKKLVGITAVYEYVFQQCAGWETVEGNLPEEFKGSKGKFSAFKTALTHFLNNYSKSNDVNQLNQLWQQPYNQFMQVLPAFIPYEISQVPFLIKINSAFPKYYRGAFDFLLGTFNLQAYPNNADYLSGAFISYEFQTKDSSEILSRKDADGSFVANTKKDFETYLNTTEKSIFDILKNIQEEKINYSKAIDDLRDNKSKEFTEWYNGAQNKVVEFNKGAEGKIAALEKSYEELLRLQKPADYWKKRAEVLKKEGWKSVYWLITLVAIACFTLYLLLWQTPEGMLLSFITGQASAIKWSIVYVTFISFLAYGIRALNKIAFSSFHLARDAEEREQLTYVYLAMIKDKSVEEKDRNLIMQSLFSRADTGLLKEDSSPTMPGGLADKIKL